MNNTNKNYNLENETIETMSLEDEIQTTENSVPEATSSVYYIPYYANGCLCWRRNDGNENDIPDPLPIEAYTAHMPIHTVMSINDLSNVIDRCSNNSSQMIYIINYGDAFNVKSADGSSYNFNVSVNTGDICRVGLSGKTITSVERIVTQEVGDCDGYLVEYFDTLYDLEHDEGDGMKYFATIDPYANHKIDNIARNVKTYGAVGNGIANDTEAFITALANNRRVYVPGGTYKITGELVVRDNCELELAQDAVLDFDIPDTVSSYQPIIDPEVGIELWNEERIVSAKKCITLNMLSSLVGNRATIRVPYDFDGIVVYATTRNHSSVMGVDPFINRDPQWKPGRYLKDINITKAIQQNEAEMISDNKLGLHESIDGGCNGTAILIEGYRSDITGSSTYIWGLEYSGLRIAGAFKFGVYGTNNWIWDTKENGEDYMHWAWLNDMKINGIIDGCEVGVYLNHCNHVYISTSVQPRLSINSDKYAKYGIYLNNCVNVDLIGSRVWDWTEKLTHGGPVLDPNDPEANIMYQHIRLDNDCHGLILDDFYYYEMDEYDIRDLIYTDTPENFDTMSILQEPVTRYFKKSGEGKPLFNNGESSKELVLKDYFDEHFQTEKLYYYENNILPYAKHDEDEQLNEYGCVDDMVISSKDGKVTDTNYITTGYIECTPNTTLYFKGLDLCKNSSHYSNKIIYYYSISEDVKDIYKTDYFNQNNMVASDSVNYKSYGDSISSITVPVTDKNNSDLVNLKYIRICCHVDDKKDPIVSTEPITCTPRGYITDNVYVKEEFVEKQTTINTDSTDDQIPSAKAVYDLLESALGEYVTDIAELVGGDA